MFNKNKSSGWTSNGKVFKTKNPHSLEHLKNLYTVLCKNQTVTENNLSLLVETLRAISEILIWGDQNDSSVFDFFLEKNMLVFFLNFMSQKSGQSICVQLLQTLNILFDNISNETSVYYLLSNNHINSIIIHKFDFSDEEVMAYYISFLKTLSMRLNKHTIHFFYNEHTNDFALYTEAIKFFNNPESMVRIAVRTITLNVYKACKPTQIPDTTSNAVDDGTLLRYIRDKTASPYFSNLVWFIGNHVLEINNCLKNDNDHNSRSKLADLVAEHLDHLHYLNDIFSLQIDVMNEILSQQLMNRLILPLYVASLITPDSTLMSNSSYVVQAESESSAVLANNRSHTEQIANFTVLASVSSTSINDNKNPKVDQVVALFLLSQVFLIIHHAPLVHELADIIFNADVKILEDSKTSPKKCAFAAPTKSLVQSLEDGQDPENRYEQLRSSESSSLTDNRSSSNVQNAIIARTQYGLPVVDNSTDEEKLLRSFNQLPTSIDFQTADDLHLDMRPFLAIIFASLDCNPDDYKSLFSLCLLHAITHNPGVNVSQLASIHIPSTDSTIKHHYNSFLVQKLVNVMSLCCQNGSKVRLVTLELSICLLKLVAYKEGQCFLQDGHLAAVESVREESNLLLRSFYKVWEKCEEIFLDMFEDEYRNLLNRPLNVEYLMMDASVLLPPTVTPLTGIEFSKRLPCGEVERARKAIRVFFLLRRLSFDLRNEVENDLPLTKDNECVRIDNVLDLNNSDLIACMIISSDGKRERRFLVINVIQMILVEPDSRRLGWGVARFVGFLQDVDVMSDKEDSRCLHVTIHKPNSSPSPSSQVKPHPLLSAKFLFDDHIRCMAARQRLTKGRLKARQKKMQMIANLLDLPTYSLEPVTRISIAPDPNLPGHHRPGQAQRRGKITLYNSPSLTTSSLTNENNLVAAGQSDAYSAMRDHDKRSRKVRTKLNETLARQDKLSKELPSSVIMSEAMSMVQNTIDAAAEQRSKYFLARSEIDAKKKKYLTSPSQMTAKMSIEVDEKIHNEKLTINEAATSKQNENKGYLDGAFNIFKEKQVSDSRIRSLSEGRSSLPLPLRFFSGAHKLRSRTNSESPETKQDQSIELENIGNSKSKDIKQNRGFEQETILDLNTDNIGSGNKYIAETSLKTPVENEPEFCVVLNNVVDAQPISHNLANQFDDIKNL